MNAPEDLDSLPDSKTALLFRRFERRFARTCLFPRSRRWSEQAGNRGCRGLGTQDYRSRRYSVWIRATRRTDRRENCPTIVDCSLIGGLPSSSGPQNRLLAAMRYALFSRSRVVIAARLSAVTDAQSLAPASRTSSSRTCWVRPQTPSVAPCAFPADGNKRANKRTRYAIADNLPMARPR